MKGLVIGTMMLSHCQC